MDIRLSEYRQDVKDSGTDDFYTEMPFKGLPPALVRADKKVRVIKQSGRSLGFMGRMIAPDPCVDSPIFLERPDINYHRIDSLHWETTWTYIMAVADDLTIDIPTLEAWPVSPTFAT